MKTILIADEDIRVRNLIRLVFSEHTGYKVIAASNGADAILKAIETKPDVVLIDVSLSNQNGYRVSREIKNDPLLKGTPVLLLTSPFVASNEKRIHESCADDIIVKPLEPEDIAERVIRWLENKEKSLSHSHGRQGVFKDKARASLERFLEGGGQGYLDTFKFFFLHYFMNLKSFLEILEDYVDKLNNKSNNLNYKVIPSVKFTPSGSDKRNFLIPLVCIGIILLVSIPIVFAGKKEKTVFSLSGALTSGEDVVRPKSISGFGALVSHSESSEEALKEITSEFRHSKAETKNASEVEKSGIERQAKQAANESQVGKSKLKKKQPEEGGYTVRRGDTLWGIANRFNTSPESLRVANNIIGDRIYPGKVLTIPRGRLKEEIPRDEQDEDDTLRAGKASGGMKIIDWSFYSPWSGIAVVHHIFIENTSDISYKDIVVKIYYYSSPDLGRTKRGEITTTLPIFVPRNSKKIYLEEGVTLRGDFNIHGMRVQIGSLEIVEAVPLNSSYGYSKK